MNNISENVRRILNELPPGVTLAAAAKTRTPQELTQALNAGLQILGENYVQEGEAHYQALGHAAQWHCIGHLQKNKVKKAVEIFDMIQTVDTLELAQEIDKRARTVNKTMEILIEVNSGREEQKAGVQPEHAAALSQSIAGLANVKLTGLMTMGPVTGNPEDARPYFTATRQVFETIKALHIPNVEMRWLSMGMTNSYKVAIEEGSNMVRLGTLIFGERN
jgi:pyridoxal phosphate enzyme (YggS family)